jgi:hypothetical protein
MSKFYYMWIGRCLLFIMARLCENPKTSSTTEKYRMELADQLSMMIVGGEFND